jgi:hypothetical protein
MSRRILILVSTILVVSISLSLIPMAAPASDLVVVNHEKKQCSKIPGGDECSECVPHEQGWEILGEADWGVACPTDYEFIENIYYVCQPFKNEFCVRRPIAEYRGIVTISS